MNRIFGLPAHPLLVHVPVILIPLLGILALLFVVRPAWRQTLAVPTAALAVITLVGTLLAANSGESLRDQVNRNALVHAHAEMGDQLKIIGVLFCLAVLGTVVLEHIERRGWKGPRLPAQRQLLTLAFAATILMAGFATVWDVRTGHSGAQAVWSSSTNPVMIASGQVPETPTSTPASAP